MRYAFFLFVVLTYTACQGQKAELTKTGANSFGAEISTDGAIMVDDIDISKITEEESDVTLKGTINEVCQAKGCWMTVESKDSDKSIFVKFKDYAFFVPKDAMGKEVVIKGKLYAEITSVDELRHYAEDKGKSKEEIEAITEPKKEIKMMADGVVIYNE